MKRMLLLAAAFATCTASVLSQNINLQNAESGTRVIVAGETEEIQWGGYVARVSAPIVLEEGDALYVLRNSTRGNSLTVAEHRTGRSMHATVLAKQQNVIGSVAEGQVVTGPAEVRLGWISEQTISLAESQFNTQGQFNYAIYRKGGGGAVQSTPSNVAVIPNDENGQFEVILESSVDLVTWNPANPGTFGGDTPRRFFRTRIVRKN